jgi:hypothetical protein
MEVARAFLSSHPDRAGQHQASPAISSDLMFERALRAFRKPLILWECGRGVSTDPCFSYLLRQSN